MSLLAIIFIATAIPFSVIFVAFTWFYIRSRFTEQKKTPRDQTGTYSSVSMPVVEITPGNHVPSMSSTIPTAYTTSYSQPIINYRPTYKPLSHFLDTSSTVITVEEPTSSDYDILHDLTIIPGISKQIEQGLHQLGYTCIEQIARWGRADVRAVSADLGIDQQRIEDEWIATARLIMSLK